MGKVELSKRLKKIANYVKKDEMILDIGSDHAYLPIYLVEEEFVPSAIAGEVVAGPFQKAKKEVDNHNLSDKISVRFGNGFDVIENDEKIGSIFICGMGGLLIAEIIQKGNKEKKITKDSRLILQANNKEKELRTLLMALDFKIIEESMIKEKNKFYEIIVAEKSKKTISYDQKELFFGPILLEKNSQTFKNKWANVLANNQKIISQLHPKKHRQKIKKLKILNQKIEKGIE